MYVVGSGLICIIIDPSSMSSTESVALRDGHIAMSNPVLGVEPYDACVVLLLLFISILRTVRC